MVDLAIPLAGGFAVVLIRGLKRHREGSSRMLDDIQKNVFADISAGSVIMIGVNALFFALLGFELFHLDPFDIRLLLAVAGLAVITEGFKHIKRNVLERPLDHS